MAKIVEFGKNTKATKNGEMDFSSAAIVNDSLSRAEGLCQVFYQGVADQRSKDIEAEKEMGIHDLTFHLLPESAVACMMAAIDVVLTLEESEEEVEVPPLEVSLASDPQGDTQYFRSIRFYLSKVCDGESGINSIEGQMYSNYQKMENGKVFSYVFGKKCWESEEDANKEYGIQSEKEGELFDALEGLSHPSTEAFGKLKKQHSKMMNLWDSLKEYAMLYVAPSKDWNPDQPFSSSKDHYLYLVPDDEERFGFAIEYVNGKFLLYQTTGDLDNRNNLHKIAIFSSFKEATSYVRKMVNRYTDGDTGFFPLSTEAFLLVKSYGSDKVYVMSRGQFVPRNRDLTTSEKKNYYRIENMIMQ